MLCSDWKPMECNAISLIDEIPIEKYRILPYKLEDGVLFVFCQENLSETTREEFETILREKGISSLYYQTVPSSWISREISLYYSLEKADPSIRGEIASFLKGGNISQLFDYLLRKALERKASDIHIFFGEKGLLVRFRLKGSLKTFCIISADMGEQLVRAIKLRANIDISKNRNPKDGKMRILFNERSIDIRVSVIPTVRAEKIHLRLLNLEEVPVKLSELELEKEEIRQFREFLLQDSGFLLITGPTSSGKSTTMRCVLNEIHDGEKHIISLEDPVEYVMEGITQVQVNRDNEYGFLEALRAMLRQDPDVLAIGEVRDYESCNTAVQSSLTGHFVISTLHTKSVESAVDRMVSIGISPQLLALSIGMIINQRLVRILCRHCKEEVEYDGERNLHLDLRKGMKLYERRGCKKCGFTGYERRKAVFQIRRIGREDRENLISKGRLMQRKGEVKIADKVTRLLHNGEIGLQEALRFQKGD